LKAACPESIIYFFNAYIKWFIASNGSLWISILKIIDQICLDEHIDGQKEKWSLDSITGVFLGFLFDDLIE
jgi:hypothetical protein